jgi:hypothetical protein
MTAVKITAAMLVLCAAALLAGCDYPEAGFFEIAVADQGKQIGSFTFMVEELTDDTDLTIGFNVLLPRNGELVLVPMKNSEDLSRRGWDMRIANSDSGAGDLQLELTHANEKLSFTGTRRDPGAGQSAMFRGTDLNDFSGSVESSDDDGPAKLVFDGLLPASLLNGKASTGRWEIRRISQAQFEKALGRKIADASRRDAPYLAPLRQPVAKTKAEKAPLKPGKYRRVNPGGGRQAGP